VKPTTLAPSGKYEDFIINISYRCFWRPRWIWDIGHDSPWNR